MEMSVACLEPYDIGLNDGPNVQVESDDLENMDTVQVSHPTLGQYFGSFEKPSRKIIIQNYQITIRLRHPTKKRTQMILSLKNRLLTVSISPDDVHTFSYYEQRYLLLIDKDKNS